MCWAEIYKYDCHHKQKSKTKGEACAGVKKGEECAGKIEVVIRRNRDCLICRNTEGSKAVIRQVIDCGDQSEGDVETDSDEEVIEIGGGEAEVTGVLG